MRVHMHSLFFCHIDVPYESMEHFRNTVILESEERTADMKYLVLDAGGSSIKYAVMDEQMRILEKGKAESRHLKTAEEFTACIEKLWRDNGSCEGIAISYCGELNEKTGYLCSGGSYPFMAGHNLKDMIESACHVPVSVENDGNCAGLAELRYGCLKGYKDAAVLVIGTGIGGALVLDGKIRHGANSFAGSLSVMPRNLETPYTKQSWLFRSCGAGALGKQFAWKKGTPEETIDGIAFFEAANAGDSNALKVLREYCSTLANTVFTVHLILDLEAVAIGGGISQQPLLKEYLQKAFDDIYTAEGMERLRLPKPELKICEYFNDANLIGALSHHIEKE